MDKNKQKFISEKIAKLIGEGYSRAQASAISYNMAEKQYAQQGMFGEDAFLSDIYGADDFINKYGNRSNIVNTSALGNPNYDSMYMGMSETDEQLKNYNPLTPKTRELSSEDIDAMFPNAQASRTPEEMIQESYAITENSPISDREVRQSQKAIQNNQTVTQDINRVNIVNPFGGVGLEQSLGYFTRGIGEKDPFKIGVGGALTALKATRIGMSGYASGKEDRRIQDEYYRKMFENKPNYVYAQQGVEVLNGKKIISYTFDKSTNSYDIEYE